MNDTTNDEETHEVLRKYNKFRKQKLRTTKKPWEGPTHKKFSQYLEQDSSSESEEDEKEESENEDSDKENSSPEAEESTTEALESDNESLILPAKTLPMEQEQPRNFDLSDSEPEDPEEVRRYQERLKSRRSKVALNPSNFSVMSVRNRTTNHNRTTNLTIQPHLLDFSSSEDEDTIRGPVEDSDADEEDLLVNRPAPISPPKKRKLDSLTRTPAKVLSKPTAAASAILDTSLQNSPDIAHSQSVVDIYPLPELETPYTSSSDVKAAKSNRISTPKPTDLKASKLLNRTNRRSRNLAAEKQQPAPASKSSLVKPAVNVTPKKVVSPVKESPKGPLKTTTPPVVSKTKAKPKKSISTSPASLPATKPSSLTAQHLAAMKPRANTTASPSKFFKSKSATSDGTAKVSTPTVTQTEPAAEEPSVLQDVYDNLESENLNEPIEVPLTTASATPEQSTGRRTRNSLGGGKRKSTGRASLASSSAAKTTTTSGPTALQGSQVSTPGNKSLTLRPSKKAHSDEASPINKATASPINEQAADQQAGEIQSRQGQQTAASLPTVQPSTAPSTPPFGVPQPTVELIGSPPVAYAGVRFTSQHRLADVQDPVQSCLIHQTPQFYSILWKLLPGVANWSRTRGETCILVFEGSIEVEGVTYPRGHLLKIPPFQNYVVKNNSESAVAMFQVSEYL